ncbi:MAG: FAD-linked oxidase C-terminal domain-containing protein [Verrucomicrobiota bacterium]
MTTRQRNQLQKLLGSSLISTHPATLAKYSGDAWYAAALPDMVVMPKTAQHVQKLVQFCTKNKIPITPRGAGRGYVGGSVPIKGGILLSLHRMKRIREISVEDSLAIVEPGVITGDLQQAVLKRGLYYPPDPASLKESSIGGNIATNAGGPRCLKYGVTSHYVLGLQVVLMNGDIAELGGRTHKNKVGFRLHELFVGSEGLLGIITQATLRLIPNPPDRAALVATFKTAKQAAGVVSAIQKAGFMPCALEVADRFTLQAARNYTKNTPDGNAFILTEIDGQKNSVASEIRQLKQLIGAFKPITIRTAKTPKDIEALWNMRRDFSYGLRATGLTKLNEDIAVPRGRLLDLFRYTEKLQKETGLAVACFGHAGDGNIHVNIMVKPEEAMAPTTQKALDKLFQQVVAWNGSITGEHGIGLAKKAWWSIAVSRESDALHKVVKKSVDPDGLLNPGKFLSPVEALKIDMTPQLPSAAKARA